jgi:hypothetical protein
MKDILLLKNFNHCIGLCIPNMHTSAQDQNKQIKKNVLQIILETVKTPKVIGEQSKDHTTIHVRTPIN